MNPKKGLISLFVLFFLISGIGLGLLVLDDQNDLSSRAAIGAVSELRSALPVEKELASGTLWDGGAFDLPIQVGFDNSVWSRPIEKDPVFFHLTSPVTVRLSMAQIDLETLKNLLGPDFSAPEIVGVPQIYLDGWETQSYLFNFFGSKKLVEVWKNRSRISLISVMPNDLSRQDVINLAKGVAPLTKVKGISTPDDSARLATQVRPSVVQIMNKYCAQIRYTETGPQPLLGKLYPFCLTQAGSGFFVNPNGYIATNGHVVSNIAETTFVFGVSGGALDTFLEDYFQIYLTSQSGAVADQNMVNQKVVDAHKSKETIYQMAGLVSELLKMKKIIIESPVNQYYVQLGNTPMQLTKAGVKTGPDVVTATLVDSDYKIPNSTSGFSSSDVALLKIEGSGYPALPLGKIEEISVGSDILVVGFPGVITGSQNLLLDISANAEPTFTRGVVSAFKLAKGNRKNLIQTDASINHGNSGGPAISSKGNVVGIATYGLKPDDGSGNYNFLRDIADVRALMVKNKVPEEVGMAYPAWKSALDNYWISYLRPAKDDFEKVKRLYKAHPTVDQYLTSVNKKIGTVEDKTPQLTRSQRKLFMTIAGGTMAFSMVAIIVLAISNFIDEKRQRAGVFLPPRPQTF